MGLLYAKQTTWWFQPLWKIWKSVGNMTFPTEWNKTSSKPPTSKPCFNHGCHASSDPPGEPDLWGSLPAVWGYSPDPNLADPSHRSVRSRPSRPQHWPPPWGSWDDPNRILGFTPVISCTKSEPEAVAHENRWCTEIVHSMVMFNNCRFTRGYSIHHHRHDHPIRIPIKKPHESKSGAIRCPSRASHGQVIQGSRLPADLWGYPRNPGHPPVRDWCHRPGAEVAGWDCKTRWVFEATDPAKCP